MKVQPVPEGYHTITPYLMVKGAFIQIDFLKNAFDAQETRMEKKPDGSLINAEVQIGDSRVMISEAREGWPAMPAHYYLYVKECDLLYHQAIKAGAESIMEPENQFYGDRCAGVKGPCGNLWWLATQVENLSSQEVEKRAANRK